MVARKTKKKQKLVPRQQLPKNNKMVQFQFNQKYNQPPFCHSYKFAKIHRIDPRTKFKVLDSASGDADFQTRPIFSPLCTKIKIKIKTGKKFEKPLKLQKFPSPLIFSKRNHSAIQSHSIEVVVGSNPGNYLH